jgi:hypothetical protein
MPLVVDDVACVKKCLFKFIAVIDLWLIHTLTF